MKTIQHLIQELEQASNHKYIRNISIYKQYITFTVDAPLGIIDKLFDYLKNTFPRYKVTHQIFHQDKVRDYDARFYIEFDENF